MTSADRIAMDFIHMSNFEIDGDGSTIVMGQDARCINLVSSNTLIHDLTIDFDPLPFTQGVVEDSGPNWFILKVDPGFPVPERQELMAFGAYDRSLRNLARKPLEVYGPAFAVRSVRPGTLRIELTRPIAVPLGTLLALRFRQGHEAIAIAKSVNVTVRNVRLYSSYSIGINISRSRDLRLEGITIGVPPDSGRMISTNADGMHITNCSGRLAIQRCTFEAMGDDAINVNASLWHLQSHEPTGSVLTNHAGAVLSSSERPDPKDRLEILDGRDLHVIGRASTNPKPDGTMSIQPDGPVDVSALKGALVGDLDLTPTTEILDCQFLGNRARAIVGHNNMRVRNCTFRNTTLAAILIAPDSIWMEGPATNDLTIESCHFSGCHYINSDPEGTITVDVMHTYFRRTSIPNGEASNVVIVNNVFESCYTASISCRSVDQLLIKNNTCGPTWIGKNLAESPRAMILTQVTNSTISNNTSTVPSTILLEKSEEAIAIANDGFVVARS